MAYFRRVLRWHACNSIYPDRDLLIVSNSVQPDDGGKDVFVHISAVERAGMHDLREGQKISYEVVADKRTGKSSADNLRAA